LKTYCITGVSGYIGQLLATRLTREAETRVVGIDIKAPEGLDNIVFHKADIRDPAITDILRAEAVDTLIHLAFYTHPEGDPKEALSVNIDGTKNILGAVVAAGAGKFVMASSAAAYGSHPDNPVPMSEDQPLRPNEYFYYSWHKAEQERLAKDVLGSRLDIKTVILRPCVLIGPHINNPTGDSLRQKILIYVKGNAPPIQLIDEDDAVEAFFLAATGDGEGVFNVTGKGTLTYPEIAQILNKKIVLLPFGLLARLATYAKMLGLSPVSATTLKFIQNPIVIDGSRFQKHFGFKSKHNQQQILLKFLDAQ
jgi:UDP-glucose 4-epimerase